MNKYFLIGFLSFAFVSLMVSCKTDENEEPVISEPITFVSPDSVAIEAMTNEAIALNLRLTADILIDTLIGAYRIDTVGTIIGNLPNLTVNNADSVFLSLNFDATPSNQQTYEGSFTVPDSIPGVRKLIRNDIVRVIFYIEAGSQVPKSKELRIKIK